MKLSDINIRDPFIFCDGGKYYLYGTRAKNFGIKSGGFDVFVSDNMTDWSEPRECFNSEKYSLNSGANWAPEVFKYNGEYYMLATFEQPNSLRGVYILRSKSPLGEFEMHGFAPLTPEEWECLDGTLYTDEKDEPFLVFCHEHTQIVDGEICYIRLNRELTGAISFPETIFKGSSPHFAEKKPQGEHYVTDGPFMHRAKSGDLFMIWSTFINHKYCLCSAKSSDGEINAEFEHDKPITEDGGHGMIFEAENKLFLCYHSPNEEGLERPLIKRLFEQNGALTVDKP